MFRSEPLANAIELVVDNGSQLARPSWAASVRTIFEDASVRLAQGPPGPSGRELYESFASSINWHFAIFDDAHTFVMAFDDKRYVPERKRVAQIQRRVALAESIARRGVPEWTWDGTSTIVSIVDERPLPPWERVRANSAAYARVIDELGALLERRFAPPPGRRVIVDTGIRVSVIETALDGTTVLMPRTLLDNEKPPIGEGDMTALYYARRALSSAYSRIDANVHQNYARSETFDPTMLRYYTEDTSETPMNLRLLPPSMRPETPVDASNVRSVYEAGAVLLRTVDTDFLPLALVCWAGLSSSSSNHNIYVGLGRVHRLNDKYCTGTTLDAVPHQEYFDVKRIHDELCRMHSSETRSIVTAWSFAAFCIACGNDYTRRLHNLSHRTMYSGYKRAFLEQSSASRNRRLVREFATSDTTPAIALLDVDAFVDLIRHAYYERLPKSRRPVLLPTWQELRQIVAEAFTKNERAHMPDLATLTAYYDQVSWSLAYASGASYGAEHLP